MEDIVLELQNIYKKIEEQNESINQRLSLLERQNNANFNDANKSIHELQEKHEHIKRDLNKRILALDSKIEFHHRKIERSSDGSLNKGYIEESLPGSSSDSHHTDAVKRDFNANQIVLEGRYVNKSLQCFLWGGYENHISFI